MIRIDAKVFSLGGGILSGLFLVLFALLWIVTHVAGRSVYLEAVFVLFLLGMLAYAVGAASEYLILESEGLVFDGWLVRRRKILFQNMKKVLFVHEGLNPEWGIETLSFEGVDGHVSKIALGPLWRRRDLEGFLLRLEICVRDGKLVEEIR
ncbi:hypothetical protein KBD61_03910 [Patescibacteria group bacterium]|nr:hypothetical protein [Patescibacteria group bacterium]MBP9710141.1 hypothetical protein [Patescibacteria group bacterium]